MQGCIKSVAFATAARKLRQSQPNRLWSRVQGLSRNECDRNVYANYRRYLLRLFGDDPTASAILT